MGYFAALVLDFPTSALTNREPRGAMESALPFRDEQALSRLSERPETPFSVEVSP